MEDELLSFGFEGAVFPNVAGATEVCAGCLPCVCYSSARISLESQERFLIVPTGTIARWSGPCRRIRSGEFVRGGCFVRTLLVFLLLIQSDSTKPCPFDGTWIIDSASTRLPDKPAVFLLANGMFDPAGKQVKADGSDQKVPETGYSDTMSVRIVDDRTVEIVSKKAGRTMFTEVDTVSQDSKTLTQVVKDTTEAEAVTIETVSKRLRKGPKGAHILSGTWQAYKVNRSKNGSIITYRCTADGFSAETPLGEEFDAKFDGNFYPVQDDPAHAMVMLKLLRPDTVEQTAKRDGKIVGVLRLTVAPDGKTIHSTYENTEDNTTTRSELQK